MPAVKRQYTGSESPSTTEPATPSPKKAKTSPKKPSPKKGSPKKASGSGGEEKKMGAWSGEELKKLYGIMCPKRVPADGTSIDRSQLAEVASQIEGRDVKACTSKWARMQGKIQQAIEGLGE